MLTLDQVKLKSEAKLVGLQPVIAAAMIALITGCYNRGVYIIITQGFRTFPEQDNLYAKGRTAQQLASVGLAHVTAKPQEDIVTNARGGFSNHNFGWAIDFALLLPNGRTVSWDTLRDDDKDSLPDWSEVVEEAKKLGFAWGGDWRTFKDMPHLEMVFDLTTTQLRQGKKPATSLIEKAFAVIDKYMEEADELSKEDVKRITDLEAAVKALTNSRDVLKEQALQQAGEIKALKDKASILQPPAWAQPAIQAAVKAGLLDTPAGGSYDFYRTLTVLHRAGLLITIHEGGK